MGIFDKVFKKKDIYPSNDQSRCYYCKTLWPEFTIRPGFTFGSDTKGFGESLLHMKKGCNSCGVPVCFNCAAEAADKRGMKGHCICPKCDVNLDS